MKPQYKLMIALLAILGVGDLVMVPFMIAANHHTAGTPPMPAIVVAAIIGVATLISAAGVARGLRWAFRVAMTCRIIDFLSSFLGLTNHPSAVTTVGGGLGVVLSIAAIVLLIRLNPRRVAGRAAGASESGRQSEPSSASR
jgi:drug/metabolite transporter (DMT)-like permease